MDDTAMAILDVTSTYMDLPHVYGRRCQLNHLALCFIDLLPLACNVQGS